MLYRILTENKNYSDVKARASTLFPDGFTIIKAEGHFQGVSEHSLILEIVTDDEDQVRRLAFWVRKHNRQKTVMIQRIYCDVENI